MWRRPYQFATFLYFISRYLPFVRLIHDLQVAQAHMKNGTIVDEVCLLTSNHIATLISLFRVL
jgi:hypothetical protein